MSIIKPYRSFTSASLAAHFPALKVLFHADDYVAGASTWAARFGGLTINMSGALTKDADGVFTAGANTITSVTGTMPVLSKYAVCLGIGRLETASATNGPVVVFGLTDGTAGGIASNGVAYTAANGGAVNSAPTLNVPATAGAKVATLGYFDLVDTTSPPIHRVIGDSTASQSAIPNGAGTTNLTTPANGPIGLTTLGQNMACSALTTASNGARIKIMSLFDFNDSFIQGSLIQIPERTQPAAADMAFTQELFAGWRNLPGA